MSRPRTVALALGSGGARGYAHIGAIEVLTEAGFEIVALSGSSMGSLVGGLFAAGCLDEYVEWVRDLSPLDVVRFLDLSLSAPGVIRATKVFSRVQELTRGVQIEDLPLAFTAVATDLEAGKEIWFQRGPLDVAIRASIAIPGIITPMVLNGRVLVDGGVLNPVPIAPTASAQADLTIAVTLDGVDGAYGPPEIDSSASRPSEEWRARLRRTTSGLTDHEVIRSVTQRLGVGRTEEHADDVGGAPDDPIGAETHLSKLDVMSHSLDAMQGVLSRYRLAGYPADLLISVPGNACRPLDFHRAEEMIELGRALTLQALESSGLGVASEPGADTMGSSS